MLHNFTQLSHLTRGAWCWLQLWPRWQSLTVARDTNWQCTITIKVGSSKKQTVPSISTERGLAIRWPNEQNADATPTLEMMCCHGRPTLPWLLFHLTRDQIVVSIKQQESRHNFRPPTASCSQISWFYGHLQRYWWKITLPFAQLDQPSSHGVRL